MTPLEQHRREIFEARMLAEFKRENCGGVPTMFNTDRDGRYVRNYVYSAWLGFNQALDAVVIPTPKAYWSDHVGDYVVRVSAVQAAVESTNLGVKIV